jgi:hypothetical protein
MIESCEIKNKQKKSFEIKFAEKFKIQVKNALKIHKRKESKN